jgi:hypothetical protein
MQFLLIVIIVLFLLSLYATAYIYLFAGGLALYGVLYLIGFVNRTFVREYLEPILVFVLWGVVLGGLIGVVKGIIRSDINFKYMAPPIITCGIIGAIIGLLSIIIDSDKKRN